MSILSLEKPIISAYVYQIAKKITYSSEYFTVLLPLNNQIQMMGTYINESNSFLLPPYTSIDLVPNAPCAVGCIQFNNKILLSVLDTDAIFTEPHSSSTIISLFDCHSIFQSILKNHDTYSSLEMAQRFFSFTEIINSIFRANSSPSRKQLSEKGETILKFIDENALSNLSLNATAAHVGLTPQYLSAFFQKSIGCTFKDYLNERKCALALPFLKYSSLDDEAVAALTGFTSATTMNKALQQHTGQGIAQHRAHVKNYGGNQHFPESLKLVDFSGFQENIEVPARDGYPEYTNAQIVSCNSNPDELIPMYDNWKSILNIGPATGLSDYTLRNQIAKAQEKIEFKYGRITDLLDITISRTINGKTLYIFDGIFQALDYLLDQRLRPCIVLGNRYQKGLFYLDENASLSTYEDSQKYYKKLGAILPPFIRSCINRYGMNEVSQWIFEISYDNLSKSHTKQTIWNYVTNYAKIENIIHKYSPKTIIGGPCFNTCGNINEFESLLRTFRSEHITPDYISLGLFGLQDDVDRSTISPNGSPLIERSMAYTKLCRQYFPKLPIYVSEFGSVYKKNNYLNDSVFQACLILWFISNQGKAYDGIGYYKMSDLAESNDHSNQLFFGGSGFFNTIGLRKPSYYSLRFLNELGPVFIHQENGVIIAGRSRYSFQAVLYHCPSLTKEATTSEKNAELLESEAYAFEPLAAKTVNLIINEMIPGQYLVKIYRINRKAGNLLGEFSHLTDISEVSPEDIECFQYLSNPAAYLTQVYVNSDEIFRLPITIEPLEIIMIHINYNSKGNNNV